MLFLLCPLSRRCCPTFLCPHIFSDLSKASSDVIYIWILLQLQTTLASPFAELQLEFMATQFCTDCFLNKTGSCLHARFWSYPYSVSPVIPNTVTLCGWSLNTLFEFFYITAPLIHLLSMFRDFRLWNLLILV